MLIPDLEDGVAYTSFLNGLKRGRFRFSLAEQKETTLDEARRKAANFIRATEICADNADAPKKMKPLGDKSFNREGHSSKQLILDSPPMLGAFFWRSGDIRCCRDCLL